MNAPISYAVAFFNEVIKCNRDATARLINTRIDLNEALASHATLQIQIFGEINRIGFLDLLNGALGGSLNADTGAKGAINLNKDMFSKKKFASASEKNIPTVRLKRTSRLSGAF